MTDAVWMTLCCVLMLFLGAEAFLHGEFAGGVLASVFGLAFLVMAVSEFWQQDRERRGFEVETKEDTEE